jgi:ABC-2 type transport system permease protein
MLFLMAMLLPTLAYPALLWVWSAPQPAPGPIVAGYLCLVLLGSVYMAIGLLASCLTSNATLAFMMTLFAIMGVLFAPTAAEIAPTFLRDQLLGLSLAYRIQDFARGIVDSSHVVLFCLTSAVIVVLSVAVMEVRRWR